MFIIAQMFSFFLGVSEADSEEQRSQILSNMKHFRPRNVSLGQFFLQPQTEESMHLIIGKLLKPKGAKIIL